MMTHMESMIESMDHFSVRLATAVTEVTDFSGVIDPCGASAPLWGALGGAAAIFLASNIGCNSVS
jgi:hypothetical protein